MTTPDTTPAGPAQAGTAKPALDLNPVQYRSRRFFGYVRIAGEIIGRHRTVRAAIKSALHSRKAFALGGCYPTIAVEPFDYSLPFPNWPSPRPSISIP